MCAEEYNIINEKTIHDNYTLTNALEKINM